MFTKKLFWVLVIGFLNLVSVDAKERSKINQDIAISSLKITKNNLPKGDSPEKNNRQ